MYKKIFLAWFAPLLFMMVAFYVLLKSGAPTAAKIAFTAIPIVIWILGGFAIHREYREHREEQRRENEVLDEAKRILEESTSNRKSPDSDVDRSHQEERQD